MTASDVVVVGGAGSVGSMYVEAFERAGDTVTVVDSAVNPDDDVLARDSRAARLLAVCDTVVLAVPQSVALAAVPHLDTVMQPDALLVDTLSVKNAMARAVERTTRSRPAIGINPLFAPSLGMDGRTTAVTVYRDGDAVQRLVDMLTRRGRVVLVSAEDHDRAVASTQALTHAAALAFGVAAARMGIDPALATALGPPPHVTLSALVARVSSGTPEVYFDVQHGNPFAADARAALREAVDVVDDACTRVDDFAAVMVEARSSLGDAAQEYGSHCAHLFDRGVQIRSDSKEQS
ncbi:prephenate dehydrogenase [Rhodococcus sp. BP-349]|uniref:prephenate dehydrogenase/arogenate dehydrogenase family protein n=1 Tax=unclassified Rhodococcus (in: high G+C Gram-positive bacteria) TaxID=192944 RepID=UPI001C9B85E5|nr:MULTISPECIES: prephenate dehydrogenase/arogenate dehydrogenase family protein [unclassified Rhodococcus (in: high G+C Gram-positive bacteria)]MBY6539826.1 prephenate dehydrogenase [Rhodococcus sp. BP-363]MBY6543846.1 prephenate dehydrogenase [Rhodococcus sp. BP-369]MBY6563076.1 prephenate dehydrogenase [Rhodococcus sp. BP-370]MBY6577368.1 prephenate dehydrogenase [Rhodococcus sp. BP-364]MBY6586669.1 prephenate dehydrogenase [Rhodococcus sp. BP-358]